MPCSLLFLHLLVASDGFFPRFLPCRFAPCHSSVKICDCNNPLWTVLLFTRPCLQTGSHHSCDLMQAGRITQCALQKALDDDRSKVQSRPQRRCKALGRSKGSLSAQIPDGQCEHLLAVPMLCEWQASFGRQGKDWAVSKKSGLMRLTST